MESKQGHKSHKKRKYGGRKAISFATVKAALIKCWGNISQTAKELQINYFSLQKILSKWPKLREHQKAAGEMRLDETEIVYWKLIDEYNDPQTVRHHLETKGKGRGYGKQPEPSEDEPKAKQPGEAPTLEDLAREEAQLTRELAALDRKEKREKKQQQQPKPRAKKNRTKAKADSGKATDKRTKDSRRKTPKRLSSIHPNHEAGLQTRPPSSPISPDDRGNDPRGSTPPDRPDAPKAR